MLGMPLITMQNLPSAIAFEMKTLIRLNDWRASTSLSGAGGKEFQVAKVTCGINTVIGKIEWMSGPFGI